MRVMSGPLPESITFPFPSPSENQPQIDQTICLRNFHHWRGVNISIKRHFGMTCGWVDKKEGLPESTDSN